MKKIGMATIVFLFFMICTSTTMVALPENPIIIFDQVEYDIGDTVKITLHSESNIDGFAINIYYGTSGMDFVEDYDSKYITATGNSATVSFHCAKGDTYITVEAWAFDGPADEGGIPSEKTTSQVFISGVSSDSDDNDSNDNTSINLILIIFGVIVIVLLVLIMVLIVRKKK